MNNKTDQTKSVAWIKIVILVLILGIIVEVGVLGAHYFGSKNKKHIAQTEIELPEPTNTNHEQIINDNTEKENGDNAINEEQNINQEQQNIATGEEPIVEPIVEEIGKSVKGVPIKAWIFGSKGSVTIVLGGFHGNEPDSATVCEHLIEYLKKEPTLWEDRTVIVAPRCNPDGLQVNTRVNANNVDINRNWPYGWQPQATKDRYNPGSAPLSEPESQAVKRLLDKYPPDKVINMHQPLHMLNPTGTGVGLARVIAQHNKYRISEDIGYPTPGSFGDYCGKQLGAAMVTWELPSGSGHWARNKQAMLAAIEYEVP